MRSCRLAAYCKDVGTTSELGACSPPLKAGEDPGPRSRRSLQCQAGDGRRGARLTPESDVERPARGACIPKTFRRDYDGQRKSQACMPAWHAQPLDAQRVYTSGNARPVVAMSDPAQYIKSAYLKHGIDMVKREWNGLEVVSAPVTNAFGLALGCRTAVVPIRQFSEAKSLEEGENSAAFCSFDGLCFTDTAGGGGRAEQVTCTVRRAPAGPRNLPGIVVRDAPRDDPDLRDSVVYAYLQRSLEDETEMLLRLARGGNGSEGAGAADARQAPPQIDGATGLEAKGAQHPPAASALTCRGLDAAKDKIAECGIYANRLVCCTTAKALLDLSADPKFAEWNRAARGATDDCMREYDGILLVSRPSLPPRDPDSGAGQPAPPRSVMFAPGASFGLVHDDLVAVSEARQGNGDLHFSATHRVGGVLKDAESVCCLLHA